MDIGRRKRLWTVAWLLTGLCSAGVCGCGSDELGGKMDGSHEGSGRLDAEIQPDNLEDSNGDQDAQIAAMPDSATNPMRDAGGGSVDPPNEERDGGSGGGDPVMRTLKVNPNIIRRDGQGAQNWGDGVTLAAFDLRGGAARVSYDDEFKDKGFGVAGARWKQIDYYERERGGPASETIVIDFGDSVTDVTLMVGMLGFNEGGRGFHETGRWTALDASGATVATGLIGPELSTLGPNNKVSGSYGMYPIDITTRRQFRSLRVQATGFGHGDGSPHDRNYGENNSDFNIVEVRYTRNP